MKVPFEHAFDQARTKLEYQTIKDRFLADISGTDPTIDAIVDSWEETLIK